MLPLCLWTIWALMWTQYDYLWCLPFVPCRQYALQDRQEQRQRRSADRAQARVQAGGQECLRADLQLWAELARAQAPALAQSAQQEMLECLLRLPSTGR